MSEVRHIMTQIRTVTDKGNVNYKTRPATPAEIMEAYREICKAQGKQMYQINGEEVWLTPYAGESLNLAIRAYGRHWEAKQ